MDTKIKKQLYKENPTANMLYVRNAEIQYMTVLNDGVEVFFRIPLEETKGADFLCEMKAKHLIRWFDGYSNLSGISECD